MVDEEREDTPQDEPTPDEPTPDATDEAAAEETPEEPAAEQPAAEQPAAEAASDEPAEEPAAEEPSAEATPAEEADAPEADAGTSADEPQADAEPVKPKPKRDRKKDAKDEPDVIPGAHLEPDLVLEDDARAEDTPSYADAEVDEAEAPVATEDSEPVTEDDEAPAPLNAVLDLAADARYRATGKRKSAVARVTLKPGTGEYTINGKSLTEYFPRPTLQTQARRPLEIVGQQERMDVVAKIHGGGVSAQAGALRHGITKALVEADPNLRGELKRRGFLTRDPRVKERKKAGLKKARKRPQFSKR